MFENLFKSLKTLFHWAGDNVLSEILVRPFLQREASHEKDVKEKKDQAVENYRNVVLAFCHKKGFTNLLEAMRSKSLPWRKTAQRVVEGVLALLVAKEEDSLSKKADSLRESLKSLRTEIRETESMLEEARRLEARLRNAKRSDQDSAREALENSRRITRKLTALEDEKAVTEDQLKKHLRKRKRAWHATLQRLESFAKNSKESWELHQNDRTVVVTFEFDDEIRFLDDAGLLAEYYRDTTQWLADLTAEDMKRTLKAIDREGSKAIRASANALQRNVPKQKRKHWLIRAFWPF